MNEKILARVSLPIPPVKVQDDISERFEQMKASLVCIRTQLGEVARMRRGVLQQMAKGR
jgi:hypothetical protein